MTETLLILSEAKNAIIWHFRSLWKPWLKIIWMEIIWMELIWMEIIWMEINWISKKLINLICIISKQITTTKEIFPLCGWNHGRASHYFYRPQRSCEGYVFTGVCLSTRGRGCLPQCMLGYPPEQTPPSPGSRHPLTREQTPPAPIWEQTPSRSRHLPGRDGHCCGRYASYWNAFLFSFLLASEESIGPLWGELWLAERHHMTTPTWHIGVTWVWSRVPLSQSQLAP